MLSDFLAATDPLLLAFLPIEGAGAVAELAWLTRSWWRNRT